MKILAYNSSARGSGQYVRSLKIAKTITKTFQNSSFLILVGNSYVNKQLPERTDILKMPEINKSLEGEHQTKFGNLAETFANRKAIIESTIEAYKPDIFLVDSRPAGLNGELIDVLNKLKLYSNCKIVLLFRDIVDDPEIVRTNWFEQNVYGLLNEIYDKIIFCGNKEIYNAIEKYGLFSIENKVFHVGYIGNSNILESNFNNEHNKEISGNILITVGGGFDADLIIHTVCEYINCYSFSNKHNFKYKIVLGCNSLLKAHILFENYPNIFETTQIITDVESLDNLISEAELVITMCGYNTVTELLCYNKNYILIPRTHSGKEQLIRANIIAQLYDGIWILQENELTVEALANTISLAITSPCPKFRNKVEDNSDLIMFFKKELGYE